MLLLLQGYGVTTAGVPVVRTWTLANRDIDYSLADRDIAWSLKNRDTDYNVEER